MYKLLKVTCIRLQEFLWLCTENIQPLKCDTECTALMHLIRGNNSNQIRSFWNLFKTIIGLFTLVNCWARYVLHLQMVQSTIRIGL